MGQLLLELFSEEIPARMQSAAARDLSRLMGERLAAAALRFEGMKTFAGPRRLTLVADGVPAMQPDRTDERKGPRTGAPQAALDGFLRTIGLTLEQLEVRDGVYFADIVKPGRPSRELVAEMVIDIIGGFPWPKSMRWGSSRLTWVRPLKRILCILDGAVVPIALEHLQSSDVTEGHRFAGDSREAFSVEDFEDYRRKLAHRHVVLDAADRKEVILQRGRALCEAQGLELVEDPGLLEEVAGLVEWPVPLLGPMDERFLDLPPEVIRTAMRTHQRYFAVRGPDAGLAPHFMMVANIEPPDGRALIVSGNARVLSARLSDARFFWDEDRRPGALERWLEKLEGVTYHARLGSVADRVQRLSTLAETVALSTGADPRLARLGASLAKADLASAMVSEFPELQGVMGGYYVRERLLSGGWEGTAFSDAEAESVAAAVRDHYKPLGPADILPSGPLSVAVALADKLDALKSFFAIDQKPTGSRDPYGLRRAALGVIRLLLASQVRLPLRAVLGEAAPELLAFLGERLKVMLRDEGRRHDLVDAVFALGDDDIVRVAARIEALERFLQRDDGLSLLAGYKRAANILRIEEKKDGRAYVGQAVRMSGAPAEETALIHALEQTEPGLEVRLVQEDFTGVMAELAQLRAPVDAFFDRVLVNDPDPSVRCNRLLLLSQIRAAADRVADFSRISG